MPNEVSAQLVYRGGMRFEGRSGQSGRTVDIDFAKKGEPLAGFTPLEVLLTSLAGCSGQVVIGLLGRMGQEVDGLTVRARGEKREIHPAVFTSIELAFAFKGGRVDGASVEKALALSEERFCPVWVMLKASVPITATYEIVAA